ncbi:MAG TPA: CBS domain-containing protein [Burkholderiales bacterium]|nr:CBS domain-containing protein [Burkholderiales bacterium]
MQIREIMSRAVKTVPSTMSLRDAARMMEAEKVGFLPVVNHGSLVGVITDRDIVLRAVARGLNPQGTEVRAAMTHDVIELPENSDIEDAADLMEEHGVRRLIVTGENDEPVGVVSKDRVALYLGADAIDDAAARATREFPGAFEPARLAAEPKDEVSEGKVAADPAAPVLRTKRDQGDPQA